MGGVGCDGTGGTMTPKKGGGGGQGERGGDVPVEVPEEAPGDAPVEGEEKSSSSNVKQGSGMGGQVVKGSRNRS